MWHYSLSWAKASEGSWYDGSPCVCSQLLLEMAGEPGSAMRHRAGLSQLEDTECAQGRPVQELARPSCASQRVPSLCPCAAEMVMAELSSTRGSCCAQVAEAQGLGAQSLPCPLCEGEHALSPRAAWDCSSAQHAVSSHQHWSIQIHCGH